MQNNNIEELNDHIKDEEETFDIKEYLFKLISKWYWFALFAFIGISAGYLFSKMTPAKYKMNSSILVKDDEGGMSMDNLFDGLDLGGKTNVENHILMLQSYSLNQEAVRKLNLNVSWFNKGLFKDQELYGTYPFKVILNTELRNVAGIKIFISPIDDKKYNLSIKGNYIDKKSGEKYKVNYKEKGQFGIPFQTQLFNFIITKNKEFEKLNEDPNYYFIINDLSKLTKAYINNLSVSLANKDANGIILTLEETVPQRGVDYLNALTSAYLRYGLEEKNRTSENTVRFIDNQIQGVIDSLKIAGTQFTKFRSEKGIVDLSAEAQQVIERVKDLQVEKELAQRKLDYFKSLQNYMTDADQMKNIAAPSVLGIADAGLNALVVKLGDLYSKRSSMSFVVKDENPALLMINKEIDNCLQSLGENIKNLLKNTTIELKSINSQLSDIEMHQATLPKTEQELINIKRNFDLNNDLYTYLLQKRAEAAITTASNVPDANILDPSSLDTTEQTGPKTILNLIIGIIFGLAIPFIYIIVSDYLDDTIKGIEVLEKSCKLPIAAEIARNRHNMDIPIVKYPRSSIAETFRKLRVNLQYLSESKNCKVIAIHSTIPGEGKSFTSSNLASILALDNKKVLLVGCDLRKPRLHKIFNSSNDKGLSSFLIDRNLYSEIILPTDQNNLFHTNSGPIPPNPSELIGNGKFKKFIEQAKKEFDYIVLDNAPVSLVVDGFLIGEYADTNLIVVRQGYSNIKQISFLNSLKNKEKFNNPAIILNDTISNRYSSSYRNINGYDNSYYEDSEIKRSLWKRIFNKTA